MNRRLKLVAVTLMLGSVVSFSAAFGQEPKPAELKTEVPAYTAMHDVIMPMWHDAWPAKDTAALTKMLPAIEKHMAAIGKAELPGVLRDKTWAWVEGVKALKAAVADYRTAAKAGVADALLKAAEALHMEYEALGRVIRPVLPEIEAFHVTLYTLYHYQSNPLLLDKVATSVEELKAKMDALGRAQLPDRLKAKSPAFTDQRLRLSSALDALAALLPGKDQPKIGTAIEKLHVEYEKLVRSVE
jgi:hypothetical protein